MFNYKPNFPFKYTIMTSDNTANSYCTYRLMRLNSDKENFYNKDLKTSQ